MLVMRKHNVKSNCLRVTCAIVMLSKTPNVAISNANMPLNPRQIEAFQAVMLRGSVTAAAADLRISQPAVSRLVRDFEKQIELTLFARRGNHLVPTPEAHLLLQEVERYSAGLRTIASFARDLRHHRRGMLKVVALPAMAMGFLPRFVAAFIAGRALSSVFVHGMPSHLVLESVESGQAEIGIAAAPPERPGLRIDWLTASAVLVVPRGHRLARGRRRAATLQDIIGEPFIELAEPSIFNARFTELLAEMRSRTIATTPLSGIACSFVAAGTGVALVDPFAASDVVARDTVVLPFEPRIDIRIGIVTAAHRRQSAVSQEFVAALQAHVEEMLRPPADQRDADGVDLASDR